VRSVDSYTEHWRRLRRLVKAGAPNSGPASTLGAIVLLAPGLSLAIGRLVAARVTLYTMYRIGKRRVSFSLER